jgi:hypothetical protein
VAGIADAVTQTHLCDLLSQLLQLGVQRRLLLLVNSLGQHRRRLVGVCGVGGVGGVGKRSEEQPMQSGGCRQGGRPHVGWHAKTRSSSQ